MGPGATIGLISLPAWSRRGVKHWVPTAAPVLPKAVETPYPIDLMAGMTVYYLLPESGDLDLEKEDKELNEYLMQHGFTTDVKEWLWSL
jgi:hypothetical protein